MTHLRLPGESGVEFFTRVFRAAAGRGEVKMPFRPDRPEEFEYLARKCARFAEDNAARISACEPRLPPALFNRKSDLWRPLFALAETAGGDWPEKLKAAAEADVVETDAEARNDQLLADLKALFGEKEHLTSEAIVESMNAMEGRPWPDMGKGRGLSKNALARLLKPFKIHPGDLRTGATVAKGYKRESFASAWERYLDEGENKASPGEGAIQTATSLQPSNDAGFSDFRSATGQSGVADENPPKPAASLGCSAVADENALSGAPRKNGVGHADSDEVNRWLNDVSMLVAGPLPVDVLGRVVDMPGHAFAGARACFDRSLAAGADPLQAFEAASRLREVQKGSGIRND